jgi:hypothetical protein
MDDYVGADNPVRFIDAFDGPDLAAASFIHVGSKSAMSYSNTYGSRSSWTTVLDGIAQLIQVATAAAMRYFVQFGLS